MQLSRQLPSLRRPLGASALAGVLGAGLVDLLLTARGGGFGGVAMLGLGLYGALSLLAGVLGAIVEAAVLGARGPDAAPLRQDERADRGIAAGILAAVVAALVVAIVCAAGQRLFVGKMSSQALATIAAAGMVIIGAAPGAIVAIACLPLLRAVARALPRPRLLGATGTLLTGLAALGVLGIVGALSRADWRVLDLGPLYALGTAVVLGAGHAIFWYGSELGRRVRAGLPSVVGRALPIGVALVAGIGLAIGARLPEGAPAYGAIADGGLGMRALLRAARRLTDGDGDGFSAKFGGGDCDDRRRDVFPGAEDLPGDGVDQNCEGGDAKAAIATAGSEAPLAPTRPRAEAFQGNLLMVTIDALRGDRLGLAGYGRPPGRSLTPTLDALTKKGTYFRRAWSQGPNTPRSFPTILTGRYPSDIAWDKPGVNYPTLLPSNRTLFEGLAAVGMRPIGIFSHFYFTPERGLSKAFAEWSNEGAGTIAESNKDIASPRIVPKVIERLKKAAANKERFALWTHLFEPHSSYMVHKEFPVSLSGVPGLMEKYDYEIAFTDRWLGKLFDALAETGLDKNTAIIVMADHGEAWGEHKHYFHGQDLFEEQLRVPLIVVVPGRAPQVVEDRVALVDVAPTLLDLFGAPAPGNLRGRSLVPYVEGKADEAVRAAAHPIFAELLPATAWPHHAVMMVEGDHKLIHRISDRRWELYDLKRDPGEKKNLADAPAAAATFEALKAKLIAFEERAR